MRSSRSRTRPRCTKQEVDMRSHWIRVTTIAIVAVAGAWTETNHGIAQTSDRPSLRQIAAFELPGPPGKRFDYLVIDEDDDYLLSAHLAAGLLHVIDVRTNAVVKSIPGVP